MRTALIAVIGLLLVGCAGQAQMEISAGDALTRVADEMNNSYGEYHRDVTATDDTLDDAAQAAFVTRVIRDKDNPTALQKHSLEYTAARRKMRLDREVEATRFIRCQNNADMVREIAKGLQRIGLDSMSLSDETRRYLGSWIDGYQEMRKRQSQQGAQQQQERSEKRQALVTEGLSIVQGLMGTRTATPGGAR